MLETYRKAHIQGYTHESGYVAQDVETVDRLRERTENSLTLATTERIDPLDQVYEVNTQVGGMAVGAPTDPVEVDDYLPIANLTLESFERILKVPVPRLVQVPSGELSTESMEAIGDFFKKSINGTYLAVKELLEKIMLGFRRLFTTRGVIRKRIKLLKSKVSSKEILSSKPVRLNPTTLQYLITDNHLSTNPIQSIENHGAFLIQLLELSHTFTDIVDKVINGKLKHILQDGNYPGFEFPEELSTFPSKVANLYKSLTEPLLANTSIIAEGTYNDPSEAIFTLGEEVDPIKIAESIGTVPPMSKETILDILDRLYDCMERTSDVLDDFFEKDAKIIERLEKLLQDTVSVYDEHGGYDFRMNEDKSMSVTSKTSNKFEQIVQFDSALIEASTNTYGSLLQLDSIFMNGVNALVYWAEESV